MAQALTQDEHQFDADIRPALQQRPKRTARNNQYFAVGQRVDIGGALFAVEQRDLEVLAEVGDGLTGRMRRIVGVFEPPLLQQRSDTPCPMLPWSSCFNQGRFPTRSPRCCATERAPCWRKRSRPRLRNFSPGMLI